MNDMKSNILIFEDDPGVAHLQRRSLERAGFRALVATTFDEALAAVAHEHIALIVLDYGLPGGQNGLDFYSQLRRAGTDLPVIIVTGMSDEAVVIRALRTGVRDFVTKSAEYLNYLPEAVHRVLKQVSTERQLNQSQALLAGVFSSALDGILTVYEDQRITLFNDAAERMFGCSAENAVGRPLSSFLASEEAGSASFLSQMTTGQLGSSRWELNGMRADGSQFPLEASVSAGEIAGRWFNTIVLRDVTERKQAEELLHKKDQQLRQQQKLEAVGSLAGGVAHEFNNLLQAIVGYTDFALDGLSPQEQRFQDLEQVMKAAQRATTLTRQLLSFSRRQPLERVQVDVKAAVAELMKMARPLIGADIELQTVFAQGTRPILADPGQLQQMLLNLCINARDAMPKGGRVMLRVEPTELTEAYCQGHSSLKPGRYLLISVSDNGCGMAPEVKERIFEPFFTTKEVGKGTGLGLAMVYGMVLQHQGSIQVYSEPDAGTTFRIYFPMVETHTELLTREAANDTPPGGSETILIADDEPMVRELLVRVLSRAGYRVLVARDGEDALKVFMEHVGIISLALLDVVMPKKGGNVVYHRLKEIQPDLQVLFCSGHDPTMDQTEVISEQGLPFIQKPFDPRDLLQKVRKALDSQPQPVFLQASPLVHSAELLSVPIA